MLTVVALYTLLLSTTFCLNFTFAYTISSSSSFSKSSSSSSSLDPTSTIASVTSSTAVHKHHKRHYEGGNLTAAKGYEIEEETPTHHIGIFVTSFSTTTTRTMSTTMTTTDDDDNEQFISSARDFQIGFRKFLQFFKVEMEKSYEIDFLDYQGNYFFTFIYWNY